MAALLYEVATRELCRNDCGTLGVRKCGSNSCLFLCAARGFGEGWPHVKHIQPRAAMFRALFGEMAEVAVRNNFRPVTGKMLREFKNARKYATASVAGDLVVVVQIVKGGVARNGDEIRGRDVVITNGQSACVYSKAGNTSAFYLFSSFDGSACIGHFQSAVTQAEIRCFSRGRAVCNTHLLVLIGPDLGGQGSHT